MEIGNLLCGNWENVVWKFGNVRMGLKAKDTRSADTFLSEAILSDLVSVKRKCVLSSRDGDGVGSR